MAFEAERMQILKMLEEGKINAGEAAKLLAALEQGAKSERGGSAEPEARGPRKRRVRIAVTDSATGKQRKVNVNLPFGVMSVFRKMGGRFPGKFEGIDLDAILNAIDEDVQGKVIDIQADEDGKRVEIFVE